MSVVNCNRIGCDAIMCDRYSPQFGSLCDECFEELVKVAERLRGIVDVPTFMRTPPDRRMSRDDRIRQSMADTFPKRID